MKRVALLIGLLIALPAFVFASGKGEQAGAAAATGEKSLKDFEFVYVTKIEGLPWYDSSKRGIADCAKKYGFKATTTGPAKADAALQAQMIEDFIAKGVKAISCNVNDPASVEIVYQKARALGIITLVHEGATMKNIDYSVEAMTNDDFGRTMMERMAKAVNDEGGYAWFVGALTNVSHNEWVDAGMALQKEKYPKMHNVLGGTNRLEENEDQTIAHDKVAGLLKTYPDLTLILGSPMSTVPGAALAVKEKGLEGKIMIGGTGIPSTAGQYIKDGTVHECYLWSPYEIGYVQAYVAMQTYLGKKLATGDNLDNRPGFTDISVVTNKNGAKVIYGKGSLIMNKDNLAEFEKMGL